MIMYLRSYNAMLLTPPHELLLHNTIETSSYLPILSRSKLELPPNDVSSSSPRQLAEGSLLLNLQALHRY